MNPIDLRSDTVTKPTEAMRKVMADAPVGDDVYGEDATVNRLQTRVAELLGKEDALFVSSGSMGNLISLYLLAGRGGEVLAHEHSHIIHYELASGAAIAGCQIIAIAGERGILKPETLEPRVRGPVYHNARTKLVEVENTGNLAGGTCYTEADLAAVRRWADGKRLPVHMDGARLWNAAAALGVDEGALAQHAQTVTVCFSKALGAPVGSVLAGPKDFIDEARRVRKMLGGGMRQAGIIAAGALYALDHHRAGLAADHRHAKLLADALNATGWAKVGVPETNIVIADVDRPADDVIAALGKRGVLASSMGAAKVRVVTHLDVSAEQTAAACEAIRTLF
jgi:threonine aldolase